MRYRDSKQSDTAGFEDDNLSNENNKGLKKNSCLARLKIVRSSTWLQ